MTLDRTKRASAVATGAAEGVHRVDRLSPPQANVMPVPRNETMNTAPTAPAYVSWTMRDMLWLVSSALLVLAVPYWCGRGRIFWEDEMLGYMLLHDPSFHHMLSSWRHGADGGGITFYLTGRLWFDLFSATVRSFRMYSEVCFTTAYVLSWITMRRFYTAAVVTWGALSIWSMSPLLIQHMTEGRFYGLFMAAIAACIYLYVEADGEARLGFSMYAGVFLSHAVLVTSHLLGVAYSFFVVLAMVLLDCSRRRFRPALYLSAIATWSLLIPSLPAIRASARVGKPYFWTVQPGPLDFISIYTGFALKLGVALFALLVAVTVALALQKRIRSTIVEHYQERRPIFVIGVALFIIPPAFYIEGLFGPALCTSRYLQPVALATVYLVVELLATAVTVIPEKLRNSRAAIAAVWTTFAICLAINGFIYRPRHTGLELDYTQALTAILPRGVPVVVEDAFGFTELIGLQHQSGVDYTYLLDWKNSLSPNSPRLEVTQYHLMENWKEAGYFSGSIQHIKPFLEEHPSFYSVSFRDVGGNGMGGPKEIDRSVLIGSKLHERLASDGDYHVSLYKLVRLGEVEASVWYFSRKSSSRPG